MDFTEYLTVVHDPNPPYSPIEALRELEQHLVGLSRSTTCIPADVRLNPADVLKLQSAIPARDYPAPPTINALLGVAMIVDADVMPGMPEWGECRMHGPDEACRLRSEGRRID